MSKTGRCNRCKQKQRGNETRPDLTRAKSLVATPPLQHTSPPHTPLATISSRSCSRSPSFLLLLPRQGGPREHVRGRSDHGHRAEGGEPEDLSGRRLHTRGSIPAAPLHVLARGLKEEQGEDEQVE
eukprot:scaffold27167_cov112-Isochrysis_galbana.AAC.2